MKQEMTGKSIQQLLRGVANDPTDCTESVPAL